MLCNRDAGRGSRTHAILPTFDATNPGCRVRVPTRLPDLVLTFRPGVAPKSRSQVSLHLTQYGIPSRLISVEGKPSVGHKAGFPFWAPSQGFPQGPTASLVPVTVFGHHSVFSGSSNFDQIAFAIRHRALASSSHDNTVLVHDRRGDSLVESLAPSGRLRLSPLAEPCVHVQLEVPRKSKRGAQDRGRLSQTDEVQCAQAAVCRSTLSMFPHRGHRHHATRRDKGRCRWKASRGPPAMPASVRFLAAISDRIGQW